MVFGKFTNSMDANGRVIFPADFRKEMGEKIFITKGLFNHCLCAYSEAEWRRICDNLKNYPESKVSQVKAWLFGSLITVVPDKQGRFFISSELIKHANLSRDVIFVGMDSRVDIWDAGSYTDMYNNLNFQEIADVLTEIGF